MLYNVSRRPAPHKLYQKHTFSRNYKRPNFHNTLRDLKDKPLIFIGGTSHLSIFDKKHVNYSNPNYFNCSKLEMSRARHRVDIFKAAVMPNVNLHTYRGMCILDQEFESGISTKSLPEKQEFRIKQCSSLFNAMRMSPEYVCLLELGTNDIKSFTVNPSTSKVFKVRQNALSKWSNLSHKNKIKLSIKKTMFLQTCITDHIERKVVKFLQAISSVVQETGFVHVIFSSLLERNWELAGVYNLPFWFAHINSMFYAKLNKLDGQIINKHGKVVKFSFVNVSEQYFLAEKDKNVHSIFRQYETVGGMLTHRNSEAIKKIVEIYLEKARKCLHT